MRLPELLRQTLLCQYCSSNHRLGRWCCGMLFRQTRPTPLPLCRLRGLREALLLLCWRLLWWLLWSRERRNRMALSWARRRGLQAMTLQTQCTRQRSVTLALTTPSMTTWQRTTRTTTTMTVRRLRSRAALFGTRTEAGRRLPCLTAPTCFALRCFACCSLLNLCLLFACFVCLHSMSSSSSAQHC